MIKILQLSALIIATTFVSPVLSATAASKVPSEPTASESISESISDSSGQPKLSVVERMRAITPVDYRKWSIRSGCISSTRVKRIKFIDDRTALLSLLGKKKAVLRLETSCPGIKRHGFSYASDGQRLCTRHTRFSVLGGAYACKVASISPYMELEDPPELQEYD